MSTADVASPVFSIQPADERGHADHGWLNAYHSFSFADYFDPKYLHWGALRVFNDDRIAPGQGFPPHAHHDMEIVTYVFSGQLAHKDSIGNQGVVKPGGIQYMSAGTGVRHSEFNASNDTPLHLVQMWVLPGELGTPPTYGQLDFTLEDRRDRWLTCVSGDATVEAPIRITQDATLRVARLENIALEAKFAPKRYGFVFVGEGAVIANGKQLGTGDAVRMFDVPSLKLEGVGEIVLWDLPAVDSA
jgi:redox-sensitive bicupin YhaK (pirin superfamily)